MSKVKVTGNENVKIVFCACLASSNVDRFTSNQDQNDQRHISSDTLFLTAKMLRFC